MVDERWVSAGMTRLTENVAVLFVLFVFRTAGPAGIVLRWVHHKVCLTRAGEII